MYQLRLSYNLDFAIQYVRIHIRIYRIFRHYEEELFMSIATLVLGILSILFIFTGSGIPEALVLGIVGIVLGHFAKKKEPYNKYAKAGFICSIIGTAISGVLILIVIFLFGSMLSGLGSLLNAAASIIL